MKASPPVPLPLADLCEQVAKQPDDRQARLQLAIALGDAGDPAGALTVIRALANRLANDGYLLAAMVVVKIGLEHAPDDRTLITTLRTLHARGVRAKSGDLPAPPPLRQSSAATKPSGDVHKLAPAELLKHALRVGSDLGPAQAPAIPLPMPLFGELAADAFVETVKRLHYGRVSKGTVLIQEGSAGDNLLIVASGHVEVTKNGAALAKLGPGMVIGEIALITGGRRSATVTAAEEVEYFELGRHDVELLAKEQPPIAEELLAYCRKRLIGNLVNTSPLFRCFDEVTRYSLIDHFRRREFRAGQAILTEGQAGPGLFVLASGEVNVTVDRGGGAMSVAILNPGDVFGEASCLTGQPASATVTAKTRVAVLLLERADFDHMVNANPSVRDYLTQLSSGRLEATNAAVMATEIVNLDDLVIS